MARNIPYKHQSCNSRIGQAFTLIELLVTTAVISLLLGILLPVLGKARTASKRIECQCHLKQIFLGWEAYFRDSDDAFYQGVNANHEFGGWKGYGNFSRHRPLNRQMGLTVDVNSPSAATVFRCPADRGGILGRPPVQKAYDYFGNSYQANILLIGPDQVGVPDNHLRPLHEAVNQCMRNLKRSQVSRPSELLLMGDNPWVNQWMPMAPRRTGWHGPVEYHNVVFLDGHAAFVHIRKGLYIADEYRVLPFAELYELARAVQQKIPYE